MELTTFFIPDFFRSQVTLSVRVSSASEIYFSQDEQTRLQNPNQSVLMCHLALVWVVCKSLLICQSQSVQCVSAHVPFLALVWMIGQSESSLTLRFSSSLGEQAFFGSWFSGVAVGTGSLIASILATTKRPQEIFGVSFILSEQ